MNWAIRSKVPHFLSFFQLFKKVSFFFQKKKEEKGRKG
jgi:hypothetical protein